jgi:hypothetical protein
MRADQKQSNAYSDLWATIVDTKAYILLQTGNWKESLQLFEQMRTSDSNYRNLGPDSGPADSLFRYAIAQYASGADEAIWAANLDAAINKRAYTPTHELYTLRKFIFADKTITEMLQKQNNASWPQIPKQGCPNR